MARQGFCKDPNQSPGVNVKPPHLNDRWSSIVRLIDWSNECLTEYNRLLPSIHGDIRVQYDVLAIGSRFMSYEIGNVICCSVYTYMKLAVHVIS